jgi:GNAT superfamily N-acetyltransferase
MDNRVVGFTSVLEERRIGPPGVNIGKNNARFVLLSQFIILPPYQGLGLGSALLKIVYDYYIKQDKNCVEFSVEEPSDEFQSLMDQIELKMIW